MANLRARFGHVTTWLGILAGLLPIAGVVLVGLYSFATPGAHVLYLAIALSTAVASQVCGALAGFLFGIPRAVSSGELRHQATASARDRVQPTPAEERYTLSPNLAEVSDWLTKLLLGAGLVELTKLGKPIGRLITAVARGLQQQSSGSVGQAAQVMAGSILIGGVVVGFLEGYTLTTTWYQRKLNPRRSHQ